MSSGRRLRLGPYGMHALLLAYSPVLLLVDGRVVGIHGQLALGVVTFGLVIACSQRLRFEDRWLVWLCVPIATLFEVLGSIVWGGYLYRFGNIPLYVPPGHALVYVFGLTAAALPLVRRHERAFRRLVLAAATCWAVAGVTVLPLLTERADVQGALCLPLLAWCILRSSRGTMFAAIWIATAELELAGTWAGAWTWVPEAPWTHLPSGNPPSAIAAGYAIIDGSVTLLAPHLARAARAVVTRLFRPAAALLAPDAG